MNVGKVLWKLARVVVNVIFAAGDDSSSEIKTYGHGQAYGLLHDDHITIAAFVDSTSD